MDNKQIRDEQERMNNSQLSQVQLTAEAVDQLADELVDEYNNPGFREWYCSLVWQYGIERVQFWRRKAAQGKDPAKLFSYFANQAKQSFVITGTLPPHDATADESMIIDKYEGLNNIQRRALGFKENGIRRNHGQPEEAV